MRSFLAAVAASLLIAGAAHAQELLLTSPRHSNEAFGLNEHGHVTLTFTGLDLSGAEEVKRLPAAEYAEYSVSYAAKSCLLSKKPDSYDANHRLVAGQTYTVAFVPHREISRDADRTTDGLRKLGEKYGYEKPLAGVAPRIREAISDEKLEELGLWYIVVLHDPIKDSDGNPNLLYADRHDGGRWLETASGLPGFQWNVDGASAFLVPAT